MEITRVVDAIDNAVDAKDWERFRSYFTTEIHADFTSLAGGSPSNMPADDLVGAWRTNLYADKLSHHMRSNHRIDIDGDEAEVFSKGYALNILSRPVGSDLWEASVTASPFPGRPSRTSMGRQRQYTSYQVR
jgi:hypothetical protein